MREMYFLVWNQAAWLTVLATMLRKPGQMAMSLVEKASHLVFDIGRQHWILVYFLSKLWTISLLRWFLRSISRCNYSTRMAAGSHGGLR